MTTPEQRDPVEELRQRAESADKALSATMPSTTVMDYTLAGALDALRSALGKPYAASDPAVLAVARELVGPTATGDLNDALGPDEDVVRRAAEAAEPILFRNRGHVGPGTQARRDDVIRLTRAVLISAGVLVDTSWPSCSQCGGSGYQPCAPGSPHPAASSHEDTEWCVFWGAEDPNDAGTMPYDTQEDAQRQLRYFTPPRGIARRNAIYGPWRVVDTEGGGSRG